MGRAVSIDGGERVVQSAPKGALDQSPSGFPLFIKWHLRGDPSCAHRCPAFLNRLHTVQVGNFISWWYHIWRET
jgi:hypothetical protein